MPDVPAELTAFQVSVVLLAARQQRVPPSRRGCPGRPGTHLPPHAGPGSVHPRRPRHRARRPRCVRGCGAHPRLVGSAYPRHLDVLPAGRVWRRRASRRPRPGLAAEPATHRERRRTDLRPRGTRRAQGDRLVRPGGSPRFRRCLRPRATLREGAAPAPRSRDREVCTRCLPLLELLRSSRPYVLASAGGAIPTLPCCRPRSLSVESTRSSCRGTRM